jgi:hypothetical protein
MFLLSHLVLVEVRWGTWVYADNVGNDDFTIGIPLADGSLAGIKQLPVMTAVKTLGSMTCPADLNKAVEACCTSDDDNQWPGGTGKIL